MTLYNYHARARRIISPVTLELDIDLGFKTTTTLPIRLHGLAQPTPEHRQQILDTIIDWLANHREFTVSTYKNPEKYGRYLGIITANNNATTLNHHLLNTQLIHPYQP